VYFSQVLEQHLMCAAVEYPLHIEHDEVFLGSGTQSGVMNLVNEGLMGRHPTNGAQDKSWHYIGHEVHMPHIRFLDFELNHLILIYEALEKLRCAIICDFHNFFEAYI